jgi:hypothetical protein
MTALSSAPGKSDQLLAMAEKPEASPAYRSMLARLRGAASLREEIAQIRREMR